MPRPLVTINPELLKWSLPLEKSNDLEGAFFGLLSPTGCAMCTTFRHRHFSLSRLIETAEVEPGKAETAERKK